MDIKAAAREINGTVDMDTILSLYGYRQKRGFMPCPFHAEAQASLKIYPGGRGWYCFGCHKGGTPIDFVMEQEGCDFRTAVMAIDGTLNMGLLEAEDPIKAERNRAEERKIDAIARDFEKLCGLNHELIELELQSMTRRGMELDAIPKAERSAGEWTELLTLNENAQHLEYLLDRWEEFRREVAKWRTTKLRDLVKKAKPACSLT